VLAAVVARLKLQVQDTGIAHVHSIAPTDASFPYVSVSSFSFSPNSNKSGYAHEVVGTINIWDDEQESVGRIFTVVDAVLAALSADRLELSDGWDNALVALDLAEHFTEEWLDETVVVQHSTVRIKWIVNDLQYR
jgi:hypothetical protein